MWLDIFIFGTVWFWLLCAGVFFSIVFLIEGDFTKGETHGTLASFVLIGFGLVYFFLGSNEHVLNLVNYIKANPVDIVMYVGGYYLAGVIWSFIKWFFFLKFQAAKEQDKIDKGFDQHFTIPKASEYKSTILAWMSYWPFSLTYTLTWKFFHNATEFIYMHVETLYNKVSNYVFADVIKAKEKQTSDRKAAEKLREENNRLKAETKEKNK